MAAECEILVREQPCSVAAIGRCTDCTLAFCASHQASLPSGTSYSDLCRNCLALRNQEQARKAQQTWDRRDEAWDRIRAAAALLARTTLQPEPRFRTVLRRKRFSSATVQEPLAPAWAVGTFSWRSGDSTDLCLTGVTATGDIVPMTGPKTTESKPTMKDDLVQGGGKSGLKEFGDLVRVADALEALVRKATA